MTDTISPAYLGNNIFSQSQDEDLHCVREKLFAFEFDQIKHDEDLSASPTRLRKLGEETAMEEELRILSDISSVKVGRRAYQKQVNMKDVESR